MLRPEHVIVPLRAATMRQAAEDLADRLVATGAIIDPRRLRAVMQNAWPEDVATIGEHAFLPHFRTEAARALAVAVGISETPLVSERDPNRSARIVIFIVAPPRDTPRYLQVMGAFARALSDPDTVAALHTARAPRTSPDRRRSRRSSCRLTSSYATL